MQSVENSVLDGLRSNLLEFIQESIMSEKVLESISSEEVEFEGVKDILSVRGTHPGKHPTVYYYIAYIYLFLFIFSLFCFCLYLLYFVSY